MTTTHPPASRAACRSLWSSAFIALSFAAAVGCASTGRTATQAGSVSAAPTSATTGLAPSTTTTAAPTTTTTAAATTTTTSEADALRAALGVTVNHVFARYADYDHDLGVTVALRNTSGRRITAWQYVTHVAAADKLGRTFSQNLREECTDAPLPPGATRSAGNIDGVERVDAYSAALDNCTLGFWDTNQFITEETGLWRALKDGAKPVTSVTVTRVVFADGSALGTAR